jgi:DNA-binding transcriptional LysR family regulator
MAVAAQVIGTGEVLCALAPAHPLARRKRLTLEEIRRHDVISFGAASAHGKVVSGLIGAGDQPVSPTVDVRYAYVACSIAASGWGLALVDDLTASRFAGTGVLLRSLAPPASYEACAMSSAERPLSTAGRELVRLLGEYWVDVRAPMARR